MPQPTTIKVEIRQWKWLNNKKAIVGQIFGHPYMVTGSDVVLTVKSLSDITTDRPYYIVKTNFTDSGEGYIMYKDEEIKET